MLQSKPWSFNSQICVLNMDFVLFSGFSKSLLCSFHLCLKLWPVKPVQVSVFPDRVSFTFALYTTPACLQDPWTGQLAAPPHKNVRNHKVALVEPSNPLFTTSIGALSTRDANYIYIYFQTFCVNIFWGVGGGLNTSWLSKLLVSKLGLRDLDNVQNLEVFLKVSIGGTIPIQTL